MLNLVGRVLGAARQYTAIDYGFFKMLMISSGILLGVYLTLPLLKIIWVIWLIFMVSALWMTYKIIKYTK